MNLTYSDAKTFEHSHSIVDLFLAVEWQSGKMPERLLKALSSYDCVYTAWDDDTCVGLVGALDDGELTAYVHYVCVHPDYQGYGVGKRLMEMLHAYYASYNAVILMGVNTAVAFYERLGYKVMDDCKPMKLMNASE